MRRNRENARQRRRKFFLMQARQKILLIHMLSQVVVHWQTRNRLWSTVNISTSTTPCLGLPKNSWDGKSQKFLQNLPSRFLGKMLYIPAIPGLLIK